MRTWSKTPRKTEVDIICYKVFIKKGLNAGNREYLQSPITNMKYFITETVPEVKMMPSMNLNLDAYRGLYVVAEGYHSFTDIESARKMMDLFSGNKYYGMCIVECNVPAGSLLFKGNCILFRRNGKEKSYTALKSVASNNIKLIRVIE